MASLSLHMGGPVKCEEDIHGGLYLSMWTEGKNKESLLGSRKGWWGEQGVGLKEG